MLGPKVTTHRSCFDCEVCVSESYRVQSDSGQDVYCTHPSLAERKRIGDTNWETPDWCPAAIAAAPQFEAPEEVAPARYKGSEHIVPLADCPMCASETDFVEIGGFWTAECSECGLALCDYSSRLDLCNDWNRRAASQFIATEVNDAMCERVWDAVFRKVVSNEVMAELRHAALFLDAWRAELGPQLGLVELREPVDTDCERMWMRYDHDAPMFASPAMYGRPMFAAVSKWLKGEL